jgi:hypothetical protein
LSRRKIDFKRATSLLINPDYWDDIKGIVKQIHKFEDKLNFQTKLNDLKNDIIAGLQLILQMVLLLTRIG